MMPAECLGGGCELQYMVTPGVAPGGGAPVDETGAVVLPDDGTAAAAAAAAAAVAGDVGSSGSISSAPSTCSSVVPQSEPNTNAMGMPPNTDDDEALRAWCFGNSDASCFSTWCSDRS